MKHLLHRCVHANSLDPSLLVKPLLTGVFQRCGHRSSGNRQESSGWQRLSGHAPEAEDKHEKLPST